MARIARVVAPGIPHHVTQRGVRRMETFFDDRDYENYIALMRQWCGKYDVEIWAYCLMPNHVHLIAVPQTKDGLARAIGEAHRRYTSMINFRKGWKGYLWQGRFASFPLGENYLFAAARYVELNPVRAHLVAKPEDYRWSSARAHLFGENDGLVTAKPLLEMVTDWKELLSGEVASYDMMRMHERTGRPCGSDDFVNRISSDLGRDLRLKKRGRKPS